MASNARFEIDIYGNTANFENSLKGINTAMTSLRGEAKNLRNALKLDPSNTDNIAKLQKNLQQQIQVSTNKTKQLEAEFKNLGTYDPSNSGKWDKLRQKINASEIQTNKLETELKEVSNGKYDAKLDVDTSKAESSITRTTSKFSAFKEVAIGALREIGSSAINKATDLFGGWVSDAADTQSAMIALKNTMNFKGNVGDFDSLSKGLQKVAQDTNANTEDTLKLGATFVGLGDSANTALSKVNNVVKANQSMGGSSENLKGVVLAYQQMSASGKVTAENINQLTDNNTALGASLKSTVMEMNPSLKQYGSFNDAVTAGKVSVEDLDKALAKIGKSAGAGGALTIRDAWDSLNETISNALLPSLNAITPVFIKLIGSASGFGDVLGKSIQSVITYLGNLYSQLGKDGAFGQFDIILSNLGKTFSGLGKIISAFVFSWLGIDQTTAKNSVGFENVAEVITLLANKLADITAKIADFITNITQSKTAMAVVTNSAKLLALAFTSFKVGKGLVSVIETFTKMKNGIMIAYNAIKAINFVGMFSKIGSAIGVVQKAFAGLTAVMAANPFVAIAIAITAVVAGLVYFFTQTKMGQKVWADFVSFLQSSWQSVMDFFSGMGQWFADLWNGAIQGIQNIWNGLVEWFSGIVTGIENVWNGIGEFFTNLWTTITTTIQTVWQNITTFFSTVVQSIMDFFSPLIEFYQSLWNLILSIINLVIQSILAGIRGLVDGITALWNGIVNVVKTVWNFILGIVQSVAGAIQSAVQAMGNVINSIWQAISNFFTPIFQAIGAFANSVFQGIANVASSVWGTIQSVWSAVTGWFSGIFNSVKNTVSSAFSAFGGFASSAWSSITGVFSSVGSWFGNVFNSVKSAMSNAFDALGGIAQDAWNAITSVFSGIGDWFANIFSGIKSTIDNALGGVTDVINGISGAINGISKNVSGLFKGSMVEAIGNVNLGSQGAGGISQNSVTSSDNRTYNTFNIQGGSQNITALAREVTRLQNLGRA